MHAEIYNVHIKRYLSVLKNVDNFPEQPDQSLRPITAGIMLALHNGASRQPIQPISNVSVKVGQIQILFCTHDSQARGPQDGWQDGCLSLGPSLF